MNKRNNSDSSVARSVVSEASPVALSYVPLAVLFGALGESTGLSFAQTAAMSALVYSGATQIIAVQMIAQGASAISVFVTATVLTLRHILMGASLSIYTRKVETGLKTLLGVWMTDESFALAWRRYHKEANAHAFFLATNAYLYLTWNLSTWIGYTAGNFVEALPVADLQSIFPLLFLAILVGIVSNGTEMFAAVTGLAGALILNLYLPPEWLIPSVGALVGLMGSYAERRNSGKASRRKEQV